MSRTVEKIEIEYGDTPIEAAIKLIESQHNETLINSGFFDENQLEEIANHILVYIKAFKKSQLDWSK